MKKLCKLLGCSFPMIKKIRLKKGEYTHIFCKRCGRKSYLNGPIKEQNIFEFPESPVFVEAESRMI